MSTKLVAAKSRLAPVKAISIPRLELLGAVASLRITLKICAALEITRNNATFWVNSVNVGFWIQGNFRQLICLNELEKIMMNPVQTNGGTFRQNVILLIKNLEEPFSPN